MRAEGWMKGGWLAIALWAAPALAQTDEIQVYDDQIAAPHELTLTFHNNYTPIGRKTPAFPGAIVPHGALNGVTEFAYGMTPWWELALYAPAVYTFDASGRLWFDGVKVRSLFVRPATEERASYYGCNLELSYNRPQWAPSPWQLEIRLIVGIHLGDWELTLNPILDIAFDDPVPDFAPAMHVLRHFSKAWTAGIELYEDFGQAGRFYATRDQLQALFATVDYVGSGFSVEFGVGTGLTRPGSDPLVFKLIVSPRL